MTNSLVLKPHQIEGALYLAKRDRALLTDPPGMMKTLSVIHGMALSGVQRPLIVCPAVVRSHWRRSIVDYCTAFKAPFSPDNIEVLSYDEIVRGGEHLMNRLVPVRDFIHLDEFHYCKHASAQRTQLLLGKGGYVRSLEVAWGTSGTPLDKNPTNIWTILSTFYPELTIEYGVPSFKRFVARFCVWEMRKRHGKSFPHYFPEVKEPEVFEQMISRMWLRRENVVGIPALFQTLRLDGSAHVAQDYTISHPLLEEAAREQNSELLRSIANDPETSRARRRLGEHKAPAVIKLLRGELADTTEKVCVFAHHHSVLDALREGLKEFGVAYVDGSVSSAKRDIEIDRFINHDETRVFVGQNDACGTGMDGLQKSGARRMLLVEPPYSAVLCNQLAARLARYGQTHETVAVQMIALAGTLDEGIVRLNEREAAMLQEINL